MKIGILREGAVAERRVPIVPDSLDRLAKLGAEVVLEPNAGLASWFEDDQYRAKGGTVAAARSEVLAQAEVLVRLRPPSLEDIAALRANSVLVAPFAPLVSKELVLALAERGVSSFALDAIPRTTLAQMMDVLSSQATIAGYVAVLLAPTKLSRAASSPTKEKWCMRQPFGNTGFLQKDARWQNDREADLRTLRI